MSHRTRCLVGRIVTSEYGLLTVTLMSVLLSKFMELPTTYTPQPPLSCIKLLAPASVSGMALREPPGRASSWTMTKRSQAFDLWGQPITDLLGVNESRGGRFRSKCRLKVRIGHIGSLVGLLYYLLYKPVGSVAV